MGISLINIVYLVASVCFILGLKGLASPRTAPRGNMIGAFGMLLAVVATLLDQQIVTFQLILVPRSDLNCTIWKQIPPKLATSRPSSRSLLLDWLNELTIGMPSTSDKP